MTTPKETEFIVGYCYGLLSRDFNRAYAVSKNQPAVEIIDASIDVPRTWFPNNHDILGTIKNLLLLQFEGQHGLTFVIRTSQIKQYIRFTIVGQKPRKLTKAQIEELLGYHIEIVEE